MARKATPKDQGWSWVILTSSFLTTGLLSIHYTSGIYYVVFLETFQGSRAMTAWIGSVQIALCCLLAPLVSIADNKFGARPLLIVGGLLVALAHFLSYFGQELFHVFLTYGVLHGFGAALGYLPSNVIVGYYFEKYRNIAYGIVTTAAGIGTFAFGPAVQLCIDTFGWRGAMWISAGVTLHVCICGLLMRPPVLPDNQTPNKTKTKVFNAKLLLRGSFMLFCASIGFTSTGISVAYGHIPAFALFHGSTSTQAASLMSVYGAANLIGRPLIGLLTSLPKVNTMIIYAIVSVLAAGSSVLFTVIGGSFTGQVICTSLVAMFGNAYNPITSPIIIELVGLHALGNGLSITLFFSGIGCLLGPPTAGWLFDLSGSYEHSFYFSGGCFLFAAVAMLPVFYSIICSRRLNNKQQCDDNTMTMMVRANTQEQTQHRM